MNKLKIILLAALVIFCITGCTASGSADTDVTYDKSQTQIDIYPKETTENSSEDGSSPNREDASSNPVDDTSKQTVNIVEHVHSFSNATCTEPSKCSCGETYSNALGHNFSEATCTTAKICVTCGVCEGLALGHILNNGVCTRCGFTNPVNTDTENKNTDNGSTDTVWIPTKGGTKYHKTSSCSNMIDPQQVTVQEAENQGFQPCKRCYK